MTLCSAFAGRTGEGPLDGKPSDGKNASKEPAGNSASRLLPSSKGLPDNSMGTIKSSDKKMGDGKEPGGVGAGAGYWWVGGCR